MTDLDFLATQFPLGGRGPDLQLEECLGAMKLLQAELANDPEATHILADRVLVETLRLIGKEQQNPLIVEIADSFYRVARRY